MTLGANGPISVAGGASVPKCGGNTAGVNLQVFKNGTQIWPATGSVNVSSGASYAFPGVPGVSVNAGDDIEFVTAANGTVSYCDNVTWNPTVNGSSWTASASFARHADFSYQYSTGDMSNLSAVTFKPMAYSASDNTWYGPASFPYCDVYAASQQEPRARLRVLPDLAGALRHQGGAARRDGQRGTLPGRLQHVQSGHL